MKYERLWNQLWEMVPQYLKVRLASSQANLALIPELSWPIHLQLWCLQGDGVTHTHK